MNTTYRINMDLVKNGQTPRVDAVQEDKYSRNIELTLFENGQAWTIPEGATALVRYQKSDGTGGNYDLLPDGSVAYTISGNVVTVALAPQVCSVPGMVWLAVGLFSGEHEINTFSVFINVQPVPGMETDSEDYSKVKGMLHASGWAPNMYLGTDENGNVVEKSGPEAGVSFGNQASYDQNVRSVNHRGYSTQAPENTIPAYILSKQMGFSYAECDVSFTSDGVAVLLHDDTVDRTSSGSGYISNMTYAQAAQYDFGSWKSADYAGTKIPTFEEFIATCKGLCLHPYIELKNNGAYTDEQIAGIVAAVKAHGMQGKVTYISFSSAYLDYVKQADPKARLGYLVSTLSPAAIATAQGLRSGENEVFLDAKLANLTDNLVSLCIEADIPLEVWTVNDKSAIENMHPYISGVTSDNLIAGKVLYDRYMVYTPPVKTDIPAASVTLSASALTFTEAVSQTLTAAVEPEDTTDTLVWSSSDNAVASVNGGVVTPVANGTAVITAASDALTLATTDYFAVERSLTPNTSWTWFVSARIGEASAQKYQRVMRGTNDVPSVYWSTNYSQYGVKLTNSATSLSPIEMSNLGMSHEAGKTNTFGFVCDGTNISLYINGIFYKSEAASQMSANSKVPDVIGCGDTGSQGYYHNSLDIKTFLVYERALSESEMAQLHQATAS